MIVRCFLHDHGIMTQMIHEKLGNSFSKGTVVAIVVCHLLFIKFFVTEVVKDSLHIGRTFKKLQVMFRKK